MKMEIFSLAENLLNFDFFPLGMILKQLSLAVASWPIFIVYKTTQKWKTIG
jgi:hypothetical protein